MTRAAGAITDKPILDGLTWFDHDTISRLGRHVLYFERADGAGEFSLPFDGQPPVDAQVPK